MKLHHQKHHQTYITNYNRALEHLDDAMSRGGGEPQPPKSSLDGAIKTHFGSTSDLIEKDDFPRTRWLPKGSIWFLCLVLTFGNMLTTDRTSGRSLDLGFGLLLLWFIGFGLLLQEEVRERERDTQTDLPSRRFKRRTKPRVEDRESICNDLVPPQYDIVRFGLPPHGFVSGSSRPASQGVAHPGITLTAYSLNFGVLMRSEATLKRPRRHILPPKGIDVLVDTPYSVGSALIPFVTTRSHISTILSALGYPLTALFLGAHDQLPRKSPILGLLWPRTRLTSEF
ncbi:hypothetical protein LguiA_023858 [Lonicera macranthoides]